MPSNTTCNKKLKTIAELCGIKAHLTYHVARHSAATTVLLSNGVPIETVSRLLGHTNIKTTQIYAKITAQKISLDMEQLSEKLGDMEKSICRSIWELQTVSRLFPCSSIKLVQTLLKVKRLSGYTVSDRIFLLRRVLCPKTFPLSRLYNGRWRLRKQTTDGKESSKSNNNQT